MTVVFAFLVLSNFNGFRADSICCPDIGCYDDDLKFADLPLPQCPQEMGLAMKVYTRQNPIDGQTITRDKIPSGVNGKVMTWFIVHGWLQNENYTWMHNVKDAALAQSDYNVIIVGYEDGARPLSYVQSVANARTIGGELAKVASNIINTVKSSKAMMYCVGHSLGAHICGHAGRQGGSFGRISGLDPAGPKYGFRDVSLGLNPSSADLVDVIHTDGRLLGIMTTLGHIDFYPNAGHTQPGCINDSLSRVQDWEHFTILNSDHDSSSLLMSIVCGHMKVIDFFTESIRTPCFLSRYICQSEISLPILCSKTSNPVQSMGFNAAAYPGRGIFYLETNSKAPFCLG